MFVYLIREGKRKKCPGCLKIGVAKNPEQRLKELQTGNPNPLTVIDTVGPFTEKKAYEMERVFHRRFRRWKMVGEWFQPRAFDDAKAIFDYVKMYGVIPKAKEAQRRKSGLEKLRRQQQDAERALADEARLAFEIGKRI